MEIKTKFEINDLVKRKYDTSSAKQLCTFDVMEVITQTCYAETQIFYLCRPLLAQKEFKNRYDENGEFSWVVSHGISKEDNQTGWRKYREDELIAVSEEVATIFRGNI